MNFWQTSINMKIKVGVFWICNFDVVYDMEEYEINEDDKDFYSYSKHHIEVWSDLLKKQCDGKYSKYNYDFFQRGRVYFDAEIKKYSIELNDGRNLPESKLTQIKNIFKLNQIII